MSALDPQIVDLLWITADKGGSCHYRADLPAQLLTDQGVSTYVGQVAGSAPNGLIYTLDGPPSEHVGPVFGRTVILQRQAAPLAVEHIRAARAAGQKIWMDCDDLIPAAPLDNRVREDPDGIRWWTAMLSACDGLVCSTEQIGLGLAKYNRRRTVLPNLFDGVEPGRWPSDRGRDGGVLTVGWVGNTVVHRANLALLRNWLPDLLDQRDLPFYWGGLLPELGESEATFADVTGVPVSRIYARKALPMADYPLLFRGIGVGVVPLADSRFSRAKTALKGLEYAASGVPFAWSDHPHYRDVFGAVGRCRHAGDFRREVGRMVSDTQYRDEVAQRQRAAMVRYAERARQVWLRSSFARQLEKVGASAQV